MRARKPGSATRPARAPAPGRRPKAVGEFDLIARYFAPLAGPEALGLGDDAAVLTPTPGRQLVFTTDAIIAGVHFLPDDPAADVAAKLIGVNLSDLAAMGARGIGYLITTAWPRPLDVAWIEAFAQGLARAQAAYECVLFGGDTVATSGPLSLTLTAIGELPAGSAMRRNGAQAGDLIFVSGRLGDAGAGLAILRDAMAGGADADRLVAMDRYRRPVPRLALGQALRGLATACIDISDGLVADLGHIATRSAVRMVVELAKVPLSPLAGLLGGAMAAIVAGDDYELLFTAPPARRNRILAVAAENAIPLTCIGVVADGDGVEVTDGQARAVTLPRTGYRHFE